MTLTIIEWSTATQQHLPFTRKVTNTKLPCFPLLANLYAILFVRLDSIHRHHYKILSIKQGDTLEKLKQQPS